MLGYRLGPRLGHRLVHRLGYRLGHRLDKVQWFIKPAVCRRGLRCRSPSFEEFINLLYSLDHLSFFIRRPPLEACQRGIRQRLSLLLLKLLQMQQKDRLAIIALLLGWKVRACSVFNLCFNLTRVKGAESQIVYMAEDVLKFRTAELVFLCFIEFEVRAVHSFCRSLLRTTHCMTLLPKLHSYFRNILFQTEPN